MPHGLEIAVRILSLLCIATVLWFTIYQTVVGWDRHTSATIMQELGVAVFFALLLLLLLMDQT